MLMISLILTKHLSNLHHLIKQGNDTKTGKGALLGKKDIKSAFRLLQFTLVISIFWVFVLRDSII